MINFLVQSCSPIVSFPIDTFLTFLSLHSHTTNPQNRGAYLEDCRLSQPTVEDGVDEDRRLRDGLWKATEEQLAAAVKKAGL